MPVHQMKTLYLTISLFFIFTFCKAQDHFLTRNSFISASFLQIKESANFGLTFKGPSFYYGMTWNSGNAKRLITYEYELSLGVLFSRDIPALGFYMKPVDISYMYKFPVSNNIILFGPSLKLEYNYNLYPDLQSGFDYWFTNTALGVNALYEFYYGNSAFHIRVNTSLAGFTSRQPDYRDPYFYDIGVKHAIKHLNQSLTFGSFNRFNTTCLELLWKSGPDARTTLGYVMKYYGYYKSPEITIVNHSIKLIVNKKKK